MTFSLFALAVVISLQVTGDAALFVHSFDWAALVVDEAHRLKNQNSLLYETLTEVKYTSYLVLYKRLFTIGYRFSVYSLVLYCY